MDYFFSSTHRDLSVKMPTPLKDSSAILHNTEAVIAGVTMFVGIFLCIFGNRHIRIPLFLIGFQVGSLVAVNIAFPIIEKLGHKDSTDQTLLIAGGVIGLVGGLVTCFVLQVAKVVVGLSVAGSTGYLLLGTGFSHVIGSGRILWIIVAAAAVIMTFLAFKFLKVLVIIAACILGGFLTTLGLNFFIKGPWHLSNLFNHPEQIKCDSSKCAVNLFIWCLLSISSLMYHFWRNSKKEKRREPKK